MDGGRILCPKCGRALSTSFCTCGWGTKWGTIKLDEEIRRVEKKAKVSNTAVERNFFNRMAQRLKRSR